MTVSDSMAYRLAATVTGRKYRGGVWVGHTCPECGVFVRVRWTAESSVADGKVHDRTRQALVDHLTDECTGLAA